MLVKKALSTLGIVAFLVGCSSTKPLAQVEDRGEYSRVVRQNLQSWEKKERKLSPSASSELRAMIADTRLEVERMEDAPRSEWRAHRPKIEDRLARIQTKFSNVQ